MKNKPLVSIIIVNWNQIQMTIDCIESLKRSDYSNFEIIVVDNNSDIDNKNNFEVRYSDIRFLRLDKNYGYAGGNNQALNYCNGKYIFVINNDTFIVNDTITHLVNALNTFENIGAISPEILYYDEPTKSQFAGSNRVNFFLGQHAWKTKNSQFSETPVIHGAAFMIRASLVESIGLFDELYFAYYEEIELSLRIRKKGYLLYFEPSAKVLHRVSQTVSRESPIRIKYLARNRILLNRMYGKWFHNITFMLYLNFVSAPKQLFKYIIQNKKSSIKAYLKGTYQGLTEAL